MMNFHKTHQRYLCLKIKVKDVKVTTENSATVTTIDNYGPSFNLKTDSYKRDPGRGPSAAKEFVLLGAYQPNIKFPTDNHRHFCRAWYQLYPWLEFSEMTKKSYCFVCRFGYSESRFEKAFTIDGYDNWKMAISKFNKHQASSSHKYANELWINACKNYRSNDDVLKQLDKQHEKQNLENRMYLKEIIRSILFLAKQGLAFRGHRENDQSENKDFCKALCPTNHTLNFLGNLLELLELRSIENELIKSKLKSLKYTHHSIQNEILNLIQENILSQIIFEIKDAKYFSIMIDETSDISRHEQVSLVIRYTDDQFHVYERFIGFERASSTTGDGLFHLLLEWLKKMDLNINHIVGQCYDGASAMSGIYKGVAVRLTELVPIAIYIHCNGHILNLCLVDVAKAVVPVRNTFGIMSSLYNFIEGSVKRHKVFEDIQKEVGLAPTPLKKLSDTRWACRFQSLKAVLTRYPEIIIALEEIDVGDAFIMLKVIQTFDFGFHIHLMIKVFLITNILSKYLQKSNVSLTQAMVQVNVTIDSLKSLKNEEDFNRIWSEAMSVCDAKNIDEPCERRKRKVPARFGGGDVLSTTLSVKDSYRIYSFDAVVDVIISSIKQRFDKNNIHIVILCEKLFLTNVFLDDAELTQIVKFYNVNYDDLRTEQRLYKVALGEKNQWTLSLARPVHVTVHQREENRYIQFDKTNIRTL
ncbi:unnamed protein product [Adineta ricciae]|uniref:TTF-type domain-containing protein n=1 Tax=Adineta ricciae TaxID=249248 RepID=A0A816FFI6_ADIRI|nr:unnamed protein product [Adineta ricciae]